MRVLTNVAPELHVYHGFMSLACEFDKMFSLCANYPKGIGKVFLQWVMDNHDGGLLFHVERAESGGKQYVTSMPAMEIFYNRNYCVQFLDCMIRYCGKSGNILTCSKMIFFLC